MTTPVYPYYDPNAAGYTIDPNAPGGWAQLPRNANYVWGYMTGTVDTTQLNANLEPGTQQKNFMKLVHNDGTTVSAPATNVLNGVSVTSPVNQFQPVAPYTGGYYDPTRPITNLNPNPGNEP